MLISEILFVFFCTIAGCAISAGFVAFITLIGVFEKLNQQFKTGRLTRYIETAIIMGVTIFNLLQLLPVTIKAGFFCYMLFNLFGGVFVGCIAGALAETLNIFPIISRRFNIRTYLPYALVFAAIGKAIGSYIQLVYFE